MLPGQEAEGVHADERLDPAHAGADRRLGEDLDEAELGGAGHVRAAAQLAGVVADLDDPDPLAVLLAEQRHGADPARLLLGGDEGVHLEVGQEHLVDLLLHVVQHARRHPVGVLKSNRRRPGAFSEPAWVADSPRKLRMVWCTRWVAVCEREMARRRDTSISA